MIKNVVLALVILTVALSAVGCDYNWGFGQGKKNIEITSTHTDPFSRGEAIAVIQKWFLEQVPNGECRKVLWSEEIEWSEESIESGVWDVFAKSKPEGGEEDITTYVTARVYEGTNSVRILKVDFRKLKACD